jgi:RNA polymerase-binding transcription factor DksA
VEVSITYPKRKVIVIHKAWDEVDITSDQLHDEILLFCAKNNVSQIQFLDESLPMSESGKFKKCPHCGEEISRVPWTDRDDPSAAPYSQKTKKQKIASELRERQIATLDRNVAKIREMDNTTVPRERLLQHIQTISDDEMIESYIKCSDCGALALEGRDLELAIQDSKDAEDFLDRAYSHHHR